MPAESRVYIKVDHLEYRQGRRILAVHWDCQTPCHGLPINGRVNYEAYVFLSLYPMQPCSICSKPLYQLESLPVLADDSTYGRKCPPSYYKKQ